MSSTDKDTLDSLIDDIMENVTYKEKLTTVEQVMGWEFYLTKDLGNPLLDLCHPEILVIIEATIRLFYLHPEFLRMMMVERTPEQFEKLDRDINVYIETLRKFNEKVEENASAE